MQTLFSDKEWIPEWVFSEFKLEPPFQPILLAQEDKLKLSSHITAMIDRFFERSFSNSKDWKPGPDKILADAYQHSSGSSLNPTLIDCHESTPVISVTTRYNGSGVWYWMMIHWISDGLYLSKEYNTEPSKPSVCDLICYEGCAVQIESMLHECRRLCESDEIQSQTVKLPRWSTFNPTIFIDESEFHVTPIDEAWE